LPGVTETALVVPDYLAGAQQHQILRFVCPDGSGIVCFDCFTHDTYVELPQATEPVQAR
jgi:hypothetical protein